MDMPVAGKTASTPEAEDARAQFNEMLDFYRSMWTKCGRKWLIAHRCLVAGSIVGNVFGTVTVMSQWITNPLLLGLLASLSTIAFAFEKGFSIGATADWFNLAATKYTALGEEFRFEKFPVEEALRRKKILDSELLPIKPKLQMLPASGHPIPYGKRLTPVTVVGSS
jgi:hypothetical protein